MLPSRTRPSALRVLCLGLAAWAAYLAARTVVLLLLPSSGMASYLEQDVVVTILRLACLIFCFWLGRLRYDREAFLNLPGRPGLSWGLGAWMFAAAAVACFSRPFAPLTPWNAGSRALETVIALAVAANEEVGWRGTLFAPLKELWGDAWALGLSTAGFTLMHLGYQPWQVYPRIALTGLALGLARLRGVSLTALVLVHFACDAAFALYQPAGPVNSWTLDIVAASLVAAAALALYFVKPRTNA